MQRHGFLATGVAGLNNNNSPEGGKEDIMEGLVLLVGMAAHIVLVHLAYRWF